MLRSSAHHGGSWNWQFPKAKAVEECMTREVRQAPLLPALWAEARLVSASVEDFVVMCRWGLKVFQRVGRIWGREWIAAMPKATIYCPLPSTFTFLSRLLIMIVIVIIYYYHHCVCGVPVHIYVCVPVEARGVPRWGGFWELNSARVANTLSC